MKRLLRALGLILVSAGPAAAQDPVFDYAPGDPQMNTAIASARDNLTLFLAHAFDPSGLSHEGHLLKVAFPRHDASAEWEHIWVASFAQIEGERFTGLLANEPQDLGHLRYLDEVEFSRGMISDWLVRSSEGRFYGAFTLRAMHADGAFGATPFAEKFEPEPVPAEWR